MTIESTSIQKLLRDGCLALVGICTAALEGKHPTLTQNSNALKGLSREQIIEKRDLAADWAFKIDENLILRNHEEELIRTEA